MADRGQGMENKRQCANCIYWDRQNFENGYEKNHHPDDRTGKCRRFPPVRDLDWSCHAPDSDFVISGCCEDWRAWSQPLSVGRDWCAEHKFKELESLPVMSTQTTNALHSAEITNLPSLLGYTESFLMKIAPLKVSQIREIKNALAEKGLKLEDED